MTKDDPDIVRLVGQHVFELVFFAVPMIWG
jgi:hypothetical protein